MNRLVSYVGRWSAVGLLCAGLSLTLPAFAQASSGQQDQASQSQSGQKAMQQPTNPNQRAVDFLSTLNQGEIQTAKTMQDKAQNAQVKDFAKMIQEDHQKAQDQLQDAAGKANLQLGTNSRLENENKQLDSRLQSASGATADREYLHAEVRDHARAIRRARALEKEVTDSGLKSYISSVIPVLQKHERAARDLTASLTGHPAGTPAAPASKPPSNQPPRH